MTGGSLMKVLIHKARGVGATSFVAPSVSVLKLHHLLLNLPVVSKGSGGEGNFSVLIGQVALVEYLKAPADKVQISNYIHVVHQRATDVVDLTAAIFTARIGEEESCLVGDGAGGKVDQIPLRILPDSVELGFDVYPSYVPDGPAQQLFSAMRDNLLWNDAETFSHWLAEQRLVRNDDGSLILSHMSTEVDYVS